MAEKFVAKVRDVSEYLVELGPIRPTRNVPLRVTYHDACHLCHGQQVRSQPRQLLGMIPGVELLPLEESELCCGAAPKPHIRLARNRVARMRQKGFIGSAQSTLKLSLPGRTPATLFSQQPYSSAHAPCHR